jgi:hypothetical protein
LTTRFFGSGLLKSLLEPEDKVVVDHTSVIMNTNLGFCILLIGVLISDYITLNDWMMLNNEFEKLWKEAAIS